MSSEPPTVQSPDDSVPGQNPENGKVSGQAAGPIKIETAKKALSEVLPSDRLALDRQQQALRAFAAGFESLGGKPVTNEVAGGIAQLSSNTIVVTNSFFCDVGFLTRADSGSFFVAEEVMNFLHAGQGLSPETAAEKLRPLFQNKWFMKLLTPRVKLGPMDVEAAVKLLGEASNAREDHRQRVEMLIDFICWVGPIYRDGKSLRINLSPGEEPPAAKVTPPAATPKGRPEDDDSELERYILTLNKERTKRIVVYAPPIVSKAELKRIQAWLSFQIYNPEQEEEFPKTVNDL